jgi:tape measure domain-containing protein
LIAEQLKLVIEAEVNRAISDLERMNKQAQKSRGGLTKLADKANKVGTAMTKYLTLPIAAAGVAAVKFAADMETQEVALTTMLGSAEKAADMMEDLQKFSASTPFQFDEIAKAGKMMIAFGESSEDVVDTLGMIGDVAAGLSIPLGELSEIYGKARVQGRLFAEDLNQLAGRGIPIFDELAKVMGVTAGEVKQLTSEGKVGFAELQEAFQNMTSEGGQFHNLTEALSQTMSAKLSTAIDNFQISAAELGKELLPIAKDILDRLTDMFKRFTDLDEGTKKFILTAAGIAALAGPITKITGLVLKLADAIKMSGILKLLGGLGASGLAAGAGIAGVAIAGGVAFAKGTEEAMGKSLQKIREIYETLIDKGMSVNQITKQLIDNNGQVAVGLARQSGLLDELLKKEIEQKENSKINLHYADMIDQEYEQSVELMQDIAKTGSELVEQSEDRANSETDITNQLTEQQKLVNSMSDQIKDTVDQDWARAQGLAIDLQQILTGGITKLGAVIGSEDTLGLERSLALAEELAEQLEFTDWMELTTGANTESAKQINTVRNALLDYISTLNNKIELQEKEKQAIEDYNKAIAEDEIPLVERLNELYDNRQELIIETSSGYVTLTGEVEKYVEMVDIVAKKLQLQNDEESDSLSLFTDAMKKRLKAIEDYNKAIAEDEIPISERLNELYDYNNELIMESTRSFVTYTGAVEDNAEAYAELLKMLEDAITLEERLVDEIDNKNEMIMESSRRFVTYTGSIEKSNTALEELSGFLSEYSDELFTLGADFAESLSDGFANGWDTAGQAIADAVKSTMINVAKSLGPEGQIFAVTLNALENLINGIAKLLHPITMKAKELTKVFTETFTTGFADSLARGENWADAQRTLNNMLKRMIVESMLEAVAFNERVKELSEELAYIFADGYDPEEDDAKIQQIKDQIETLYNETSELINDVFDDIFDVEQDISDARIETEEDTLDALKELHEERLRELERWADEEIYRYRHLLEQDAITWEQYINAVNNVLDQIGVNLPIPAESDEDYGFGGPGTGTPVLPPSGGGPVRSTTVINVTGEVFGIDDLKSRIDKITNDQLIKRR